MTYKTYNIKGQALTEIVVGLTVAGIIVASATIAIILVLRSNQEGQLARTASLLLGEYSENIQIIADSDWHKIYDLSPKGATNTYIIVASGTSFAVTGGKEGVLGENVYNGLVGYFALDEASGAKIYDGSSNGRQGFASGTPTATTSCKVGRCFAFGGDDDPDEFVLPNNNTGLNVASFTLSAWIRSNDYTIPYQVFILKATTTQPGYDENFFFQINGDELDCGYGTGIGFSEHVTTAANLVEGNWYFVSCVYETNGAEGSVRIYKNGGLILDEVDNVTLPLTTGIQLRIGANGKIGAFEGFNGTLDDIRIYNRALSAAEVKQLYDSKIYTRYFTIENVSRDSTSSIEETYNSANDDPSTQKITIYAEFTSTGGDVRQQSIVKYVTRWANSVFHQSEWSAGPGTEGPLTSQAGGFSTSTYVNYSSSSGSIILEGF